MRLTAASVGPPGGRTGSPASPRGATLVIAGSNTVEGTHSVIGSASPRVVVVGGQAQDLTATVPLPDTTWTPKSATDPVVFTEASAVIVAHITLPGPGPVPVTATITCMPSGASPTPFIALAAQGAALPIVTTTTSAVSGQVTPTTVAAAATNTLPVTGTKAALFWAIIAAMLVDLGFALRTIAGPKRRTA